ncbi:MAG: C45 family peptidase [Dethiobacteria bacterium]
MPLEIIQASGNHYDIGYTVGRAARRQLHDAVNYYKSVLKEEGWTGPWTLPGDYLQAARDAFPHLVEEIEGLAAGAGLSFAELFFLNSLEEALDPAAPPACNGIAMAAQGSALLGHNEDWYYRDCRSVIVYRARPKDKPSFITITAAPFLAAVGMNEAGIAQGVNSVSSTDNKPGIPRVLVSRAVLEAESIEQAVEMATPQNRAGGYNHLLASRDGRIGYLETSARAHCYVPAEKLTYHTNHYLAPEMLRLEHGAGPGSLKRLERLKELAEGLARSSEPFQAIAGSLRDHLYAPLSICRHPEDERAAAEGTIFSVIFNLRELSAAVAIGNPCTNRYERCSL